MGIISKEQFEELFKSKTQYKRNYLALPGGGRGQQESVFSFIFSLKYKMNLICHTSTSVLNLVFS